MELSQMAGLLLKIFKAADRSWQGYAEELSTTDFEVSIAAMVDYLDGLDQEATIELPNASLKVQRDERGDHVWFLVGKLDA
jgi:hypothetical protein